MVEAAAKPVNSLYIHVPFCARKCEYCAFYSEASTGELINRYVEALVRELELLPPGFKLRTIFFGGGTPSLLNLKQWERICRVMDRRGLLGAEEWTIECNPATVSHEKAKLLLSFGVNRISMGVQSFDEGLLDRLGRIHSREMAFKSYDILRQAGFANVNLDLMFAIPGQTMEVWRSTLAEAIALGSEHLSSYEVIYEEDTPLYEQMKAGEFTVDEDLACAMYEELVERSVAAGFQQYEVANFARLQPHGSRPITPLGPGLTPVGNSAGREVASGSDPLVADLPPFACRHNANYWRGGDFYGLGPSATSYLDGVRTKNWSNTPLYCELVEQGKPPAESREKLAPLARAGETAAFGLRLVAGWPFEQFLRVTGYDLRDEWKGEMQRLQQQGWGRITPARFQLTCLGLRFADAAAQCFLR